MKHTYKNKAIVRTKKSLDPNSNILSPYGVVLSRTLLGDAWLKMCESISQMCVYRIIYYDIKAKEYKQKDINYSYLELVM